MQGAVNAEERDEKLKREKPKEIILSVICVAKHAGNFLSLGHFSRIWYKFGVSR